MDIRDYKTLFEKSSEALLVLDTNFTIISASDAYLKIDNRVREEIVGRIIFDFFPDDVTTGKLNNTGASLNRVLSNKATDTLPVTKHDIPKPASEGGGFAVKYWRTSHTPILDDVNNVKYIVQRVEDVTEMESLAAILETQKASLKHAVAREKRYYMMLMESPFAFSVMMGKDLVITLANDLMKKFWGKGNDVEGKTLLQVLPELKDQPFPAMISSVLTTGTPVYANEILAQLKHNDIMEERYFNIVYQPCYAADETISGVTTIAYEVTEQVLARKKIEESEYQYEQMIFSSTSLVLILKGEDLVITVANDSMLETLGKGKDVIGKPLLTVIPEIIEQGLGDLLNQVYATGEPSYGYEKPVYLLRNGKQELFHFTFVYQAQRDISGEINGVAVLAHDVTEQALSNSKIKDSEERFRLLVMQAPVAICVLRGRDYVIETINEPMVTMWDRNMHDVLNKPAFDVLVEFREQGLKELLDNVFNTGDNIVVNELPLDINRNGALETIYVKFVYEPLREVDGTITGVMALAHEITDQVLARKRMEAQALLHQDMLMTAPGFVCTLVGPNHVYTLVNDQYQMLFGKREIKGKPIMVALPELEGQGFDTLLDKVYNTGETYVGFDIPIELARDENLLPELRYFNFSYQPMYNEHKAIYSILVFGYEVTELMIAKKRIEDSEKLFRQLLDTMPQIAWTNTIEGDITFYNQRWYDYTGLDQKYGKVKGCETIIHPDDLKNVLDQYRTIRETSDGGEFQVRGKRADGTYRWHLIRLMPINNEEGKVQFWMGTATDIQELRLLQQQKDDFISIASHELKTPITSLKSSLQLLDRMKDNPSPVMLPKLIAQANKSLDKVSVLIADLLNASIANEGQLQISKELLTLSKVIDDCCPNIRTEGIYTIKTEGDLALMVYADAGRIDQILINFVNNAIKYAPASKEILICIEKVNDMAKVSVIDKGPGIPPDKVLHLFDRYYRVDSSGSQYSGLGLGLYISAEIIKKHNGQIGVESELGKGSTFWFTLPIA